MSYDLHIRSDAKHSKSVPRKRVEAILAKLGMQKNVWGEQLGLHAEVDLEFVKSGRSIRSSRVNRVAIHIPYAFFKGSVQGYKPLITALTDGLGWPAFDLQLDLVIFGKKRARYFALGQKGDTKATLKALEEAYAGQELQRVIYLHDRAKLLFELEKYDDALKAARAGVSEIDKRYVVAHFDLNEIAGRILEARGKYADAKSALEKALASAKTLGAERRAPIWNLIGMCHFHLAEYAEAAESYSRAIKGAEREDLATFLANRAEAKLNLGDAKGARDDASKALKLSPRDDFARAQLAAAEAVMGALERRGAAEKKKKRR